MPCNHSFYNSLLYVISVSSSPFCPPDTTVLWVLSCKSIFHHCTILSPKTKCIRSGIQRSNGPAKTIFLPNPSVYIVSRQVPPLLCTQIDRIRCQKINCENPDKIVLHLVSRGGQCPKTEADPELVCRERQISWSKHYFSSNKNHSWFLHILPIWTNTIYEYFYSFYTSFEF